MYTYLFNYITLVLLENYIRRGLLANEHSENIVRTKNSHSAV